MRRTLLIAIPFAAAIVALIGGFYLWIGTRALVAGSVPLGVGLAAFGVGGIVLALALWSLRRMLLAQGDEAPPA